MDIFLDKSNFTVSCMTMSLLCLWNFYTSLTVLPPITKFQMVFPPFIISDCITSLYNLSDGITTGPYHISDGNMSPYHISDGIISLHHISDSITSLYQISEGITSLYYFRWYYLPLSHFIWYYFPNVDLSLLLRRNGHFFVLNDFFFPFSTLYFWSARIFQLWEMVTNLYLPSVMLISLYLNKV